MPSIQKQGTKPNVSTGGIVGRISPIVFDDDDGIKINLYGRSGTGKTTLWATFPGPILAIIASGGDKPGELRSINTSENRKKISHIVLKSSSEIREIVQHVKESGKYKTVVLDHASGLQDLVLKEILDIDELPAQRSWGMAGQQQWGQCALQTKELLRAILSLSCNAVIVAQERNFNDESNSDVLLPTVGSALSPSVTGWLNPACDYVCQTFIRQKMVEKKISVGGKDKIVTEKGKGVEYCLRSGPDAVFTTKFRVPKGGSLPDVIVDPTYAKIKRLIDGGNA